MKLLENFCSIFIPVSLAICFVFYALGFQGYYLSTGSFANLINDIVPSWTSIMQDFNKGMEVLDFLYKGVNQAWSWLIMPSYFAYALYAILGIPLIFLSQLSTSLLNLVIFGFQQYATLIPTNLPPTPFDDLDTSGWLEIVTDYTITL